MDKQKAERFAQYLVSKYGEDGAKKKIQKIQKTGKVDQEDLKGFAESEQKSKGKTPKDLHGAKLNYIKTLKHQCADDEELVYYKVGGKVDCGCKKKGGDIEPKKECGGGPVAKFKSIRKGKFGITAFADATGSQGGFRKAQQEQKKEKEKKQQDQQKEGWNKRGDYVVRKKNIKERERQLTSNKTEEETTPPNINKGLHKNSKGGAVAEFKKARCGSKMKKK